MCLSFLPFQQSNSAGGIMWSLSSDLFTHIHRENICPCLDGCCFTHWLWLSSPPLYMWLLVVLIRVPGTGHQYDLSLAPPSLASHWILVLFFYSWFSCPWSYLCCLKSEQPVTSSLCWLYLLTTLLGQCIHVASSECWSSRFLSGCCYFSCAHLSRP